MQTLPWFHELVTFEPIALFLCLITFFRAELSSRYPAIRNYLAFRLGSALYLLLIINAVRLIPISERVNYLWYFYSYWGCFLISAVLILNIIHEGFVSSVRQTPLIKSTGTVLLKWTKYLGAGICGILAVGTLIAPHVSLGGYMVHLATNLMTAVLIAEMAAVLFMAIVSKNFGGTLKSPIAVILIGLGTESAAQWLMGPIQMYYGTGFWNIENYAMQLLTNVMLIGWALYFPLANRQGEEDRYMPLMDAPIMRWEMVAQKYGQRSPAVAKKVNTSFFLQGATQATGTDSASHIQ